MFELAHHFSQLGVIGGGGAGGGSPGVYEQAALYMDFRNNAARLSGAWSSAVSLLTTTRASVAQMDNSAGFWGEFAANQPRWSDKGLLVEEARTNSIRNNTMVGAVAGSPGTLPTNWAGFVLGGLTQTIVGVGNELGIDYVDIRFSGTSSGTSIGLFFDGPTGIAALNGQVWTSSIFAKLVAGSFANVSAVVLTFSQRDGGGASIASLAGADFLSTILSTLARFPATVTLNQPTTAFVLPGLTFTMANGAAIDFTLRIGWPQLELGAFATSPIKTSGAAATRGADIVSTPLAAAGAAPGTLFSEAFADHALAAATNAHVLSLNDGTTNQIIFERILNNGSFVSGVVDGGVTQAVFTHSPFVVGSPWKQALAFAVNDFAGTAGGQAVATDPLGTIPAVTTLSLGTASVGGAQPLNGYIRRAAYWSSRLSNALLQAMTAP